jgi:uncharacterized membrane protein YgaE (UPF0421/DUF939 family)
VASIDYRGLLRLPVRAATAAAVAVAVASAFSFGSPLYAMVSAVIVTDLDAAQTRKLALPRMVGTVIGAAVGCVATLLVRPGALAVAACVLLPMLLCQLMRQPAAAKVAGYVSGIIILSFANDPWTHALDRLLETIVGILAATAVSMVPPLYRPQKKADGG